MTVPGIEVWLMAGYGLALLAVAYLLDHLGRRSAQRSASWRTGNFVYHEDRDAWKCHEDQWLWPAAFDPEKRVVRYQGQHAICGRCPVKDECSPTPGPRELTKPVDPWPHSETGRFHRGIAIAVVAAGLLLTAGSLIAHHDSGDVLVLGVTILVQVAALTHLYLGLARRPDNAPEHIRHEVGGVRRVGPAEEPEDGMPSPGSPAVRYASERRSALAPGELDDLVERHRTRGTLIAGARLPVRQRSGERA
ncbi:hypothetical protein [Ornithinimicrobium tianjinense]|uniref:Uncharacterized protein n=1 Tax=Ornithinimicrobium tianjinense TaxID=1195761 RepID=A0A917F2C6_9MICO|nr:hypothetical protein [Ornithinimicrobium tianjinense]GGF43361.1 hypothetical protein GCM10011366_08990 [Ornithinimicrobium tianjinense]